MMNRTLVFAAILGSWSLAACTQTTPSMMNNNNPRLSSETTMQQTPVAAVNDNYIHSLAENFKRYGSSSMQLSLGYDPKSKSYTAMKAFKDLDRIKSQLASLGVQNVTAGTVQAEGSEPTLMISYDGLKATAPDGCTSLPGIDDNQTTRFIGDYKFGCSIDTLTARQIYRPADLKGNDYMGEADGRRTANSLEYYRQVPAIKGQSQLNQLGQQDMKSQ